MKIFKSAQVTDWPRFFPRSAKKSSKLWSSNFGQIIPTQIDFFGKPYFGPQFFYTS